MDLAQALLTALDFECRVRDHYVRCAQMTGNLHGRGVFTRLAQEEQGHVERLEALLREEGTLVALPPALPPPAAGLPELEFLKEALEIERRTCTFYQELVAGLEPRHRDVFAGFLAQEEGHLALLQAEIDDLGAPGLALDFMDARGKN
jgi:rubrerythrin